LETLRGTGREVQGVKGYLINLFRGGRRKDEVARSELSRERKTSLSGKPE